MEEELKKLLAQRTKLETHKKLKENKINETLAEMDSDFEEYQKDNIIVGRNEYEQERNNYKEQAKAEIKQMEADLDKINSQIGFELKKIRDGLLAEAAQYKPDYSEKEKILKNKETELKIAKDVMEEAEAEYNHRKMRFYYYDDKAVKSLDDSDVLSARKDYNELLVEFNSMLRELNQLKAKDEDFVNNINSKVEKINQFFGTVDIRKTSADKILEAIEDDEFEIQIPQNYEVKQQDIQNEETTESQQEKVEKIHKIAEEQYDNEEAQSQTVKENSEPEPQVIPFEKLAESGIKADDIEISQIDFDISTGKISIDFRANKDEIEMNVEMGDKLLSSRQMNKYLKQSSISIDGKMDPYIVYAIDKSAKEVMKALGVFDKAKINDITEKYMDTYRRSLGTNVDLQELKDEEVESLAGIRYFKSEEKCDKNNFKYLMPYMREAKESTCSNVEVDTRKWYEILRDGVKSIFNKPLGLGAGKEENKEQTQTSTQINYKTVKDREEDRFLKEIKVKPLNVEHTDEVMNRANQELAKTLLSNNARNVANKNIKDSNKKVKDENEQQL